MWHASLSIQTGTGPLVTEKWTRQQRNEAARQAARMLAGVGMEPSKAEVYPFSYQLRRALSDAEVAQLDPAWVAVPAVDEGGTPEGVRQMLVEMGLLEGART